MHRISAFAWEWILREDWLQKGISKIQGYGRDPLLDCCDSVMDVYVSRSLNCIISTCVLNCMSLLSPNKASCRGYLRQDAIYYHANQYYLSLLIASIRIKSIKSWIGVKISNSDNEYIWAEEEDNELLRPSQEASAVSYLNHFKS